ncbi:DMT family transporter [Flavitalea sp. BT771]|uniref:DMT family transporter n=1 Tax=Flavitalea sp. BT771 TaxID=3063329 RepID=UPI0026E25F30|nr:DMT family transporter [Flavitalea sp. BT771]MDO6430795.1 DMT family transporter [Flavitalea sp. BT771]MDV6219065.1 DMT family transporter [Flavitalea sp. BT771]
MKKGIIAWVTLLFCNLIWSFHFTSIKLTQDQVGPYFTVWAPMLLATIFLFPFVVKDFRKGKKKLKDALVFVQLGALGAFPSQVFMTYGTQYSLASNAAILVLALPVITAVFAFLILKEKMNKIRWASFAIAIIGVVLCSTNDIRQVDLSSKYALGNLLIFLAIVGNAYYNVGCKKVADRFTEMEMVFYTYLVLVIMLTPMVLYYEPGMFAQVPHFTTKTWLGMVSLTLFHNFLSMLLFFKVLKFLDATQVALSNYMITFLGLPIAAIFLGETLSFQSVVGGVLVLIATLILTIVDHRQYKNNMLKLNT